MIQNKDLHKIVGELRRIVSWGLHFSQDPFDIKRYKRIRTVAARLQAVIDNRPVAEVMAEFDRDLWNPIGVSPLYTADAAVFRDDRLLLIKRADNGLWALPGGFVEVGQTLAQAVLKELHEETGLCGRVVSLLGIFDSRHWGSQPTSHMHHAVFLVDGEDKEPQPSLEAVEVGYFLEDKLPSLSIGHHLRIPFIFKLLRGERLIPYFDRAEPVDDCPEIF